MVGAVRSQIAEKSWLRSCKNFANARSAASASRHVAGCAIFIIGRSLGPAGNFWKRNTRRQRERRTRQGRAWCFWSQNLKAGPTDYSTWPSRSSGPVFGVTLPFDSAWSACSCCMRWVTAYPYASWRTESTWTDPCIHFERLRALWFSRSVTAGTS